MVDTNHLVSLFDNIKLDDVRDQHVLEIEYPVRGLLPHSIEPTLKPPANLDSREAPPDDQRRAGVFQSACRIHLNTSNRESSIAGFPDMLVSQHTAFESLTCGPGNSLLQAVTFFDAGMGVEYIRLALHTSLEQESEEHDYDFELSRAQWQKMVEEGGSLWVEALDELMTRRSDRGYYHVRNRLACDYGWDAAHAEEATWGAGWGGSRLRQLERDETTVEDIDWLMEAVELVS